MTVGKQVGRNIVEARQDAGLTQTELALRMRTASQDVSRLESGRSCPRLTTLLRLAHALEVPLADLVKGIE